jgi:hypothetical protein
MVTLYVCELCSHAGKQAARCESCGYQRVQRKQISNAEWCGLRGHDFPSEAVDPTVNGQFMCRNDCGTGLTPTEMCSRFGHGQAGVAIVVPGSEVVLYETDDTESHYGRRYAKWKTHFKCARCGVDEIIDKTTEGWAEFERKQRLTQVGCLVTLAIVVILVTYIIMVNAVENFPSGR